MIKKIFNYEIRVFNLDLSVNKLYKHPLFSGSAIMIIGSNLANLFAFLYTLVFGRLLGPASYGEFASILSIIGLLSTTFSFLGLVIVKFVSASDEKNIPGIYSWFIKKSRIFGVAMLIGLVLISPLLSQFLHVDVKLVLLLAPISYLTLLTFIRRSILQGLLSFGKVVVSTNLDFMGRFLFGSIFILLGFKVFGGVVGFLLSMLIANTLLIYFLKDLGSSGKMRKFGEVKKVLKYSVPVLVASISLNSLLMTDILLVKHFFSSYDAGLYASLSTMGKIIYFASSPIAAVMFPLVSKRASKGQRYNKIFILSFGMSILIILGVLALYITLPEILVKLLYGQDYVKTAGKLVWFGIFAGIYTLASQFLNFYLSLEKTRLVIISVIAAFVQIIGIIIFHQTIQQVVNVSIVSASLMLLGLIVYFAYGKKNSAN